MMTTNRCATFSNTLSHLIYLILILTFVASCVSASFALSPKNGRQPPAESRTPGTGMPPFIDKLALIVVQGRKHLVARSRGKSVFFTPGGKRESGEDDITALRRECKEELTVDLMPETIRKYGVFEAEAFGKASGTIVRMTCYKAEYVGQLQPNEEVEELAWIDSNFPEEKLSLAGRMILEDLKERGLVD